MEVLRRAVGPFLLRLLTGTTGPLLVAVAAERNLSAASAAVAVAAPAHVAGHVVVQSVILVVDVAVGSLDSAHRLLRCLGGRLTAPSAPARPTRHTMWPGWARSSSVVTDRSGQ